MESLPCIRSPLINYVWPRVMQVRREKELYTCSEALPPNYDSVLSSAFKGIWSFSCSIQVSLFERVTAKEIATFLYHEPFS